MRRKAECIIARDYSNPSWFCRLLHRSLSGIAAREGRRDDKTIKAEKGTVPEERASVNGLAVRQLGRKREGRSPSLAMAAVSVSFPVVVHKMHRTWFRSAGR